jgi:von Willebrand factor type A domain
MTDELNQVDLAFVVDTTGSMGPFIALAQKQMIAMAQALITSAEVDMRLGVVEYRDHPPQDRMVYRAHPMSNLTRAERVIEELRPEGGGDGPESVLDGVLAACTELQWRPHARRIAVLVGDAPPHGVGFPGDGFPAGCPCGQTIESVTAAAEQARITMYALPLNAIATASFTKLATFTGGEAFAPGSGGDAIEKVKQILASEFGNLGLDAQVLAEWSDNFSIDAAAEKLSTPPGKIAASVTRLLARRLVNVKAITA